jgi:hypothetical protein
MLVGCTGEATTAVRAGPPAALMIVAGAAQSAVVGHELPTPLEVRVVDANGNPVSPHLVDFRVTSGGGSVAGGSALTSADGTAKERWTLGTSTANPQTLEARVVDQANDSAIVLGTFTATAMPDAPATLNKIAGDAQQAVVGSPEITPLTVKVADRYGNGLPGMTVTWSVTAGAGSINPATSTTSASGTTSTAWTLGPTAGPQSARATTAIISNGGVTFDATAIAGRVVVALRSGNAQTASITSTLPVPPSVEVTDAQGNPVGGVVVTFAASAGHGSVTGANQTTDAQGIAQVGAWTLGPTTGANLLTATATGVGGAPVTFTATATPGPPRRIALVGGSTAGLVGAALPAPPSVQVLDSMNNGVPGVAVTFVVVVGGGSVTGATVTSDSAGVAQVGSWTLGTKAEINYLHAIVSSVQNYLTVGVPGTPGPPAQLVFLTQPSAAGWGTAISPSIAVEVEDKYGNTVDAAKEPVSLALAQNPGGATLIGNSAVPVNGVATFSQVELDRPGSGYTLIASSGSTPVATSTTFDVAAISTVATSIGKVGDLTSNGRTLYFMAQSDFRGQQFGVEIRGLSSVPTHGGPITLLDWIEFASHGYRGAVAADAQHVYALTTAMDFEPYNTVLTRLALADGTIRRTQADAGLTGPSMGPDFLFDGRYFLVNCQPGQYSRPGVRVVRLRASDGAMTVLIEDGAGLPPTRIALAAGNVYYTDSTAAEGRAIFRMSVDSGPSTAVTTGIGTVASSMSVVGDRLYWVETNGSLRSVPLTGGTPVTHLTGVGTGQLLTDGTYLYVNDGALRRYAVSDWSVTTLVSANVGQIALDAEAIYWTEYNVIRKMRR